MKQVKKNRETKMRLKHCVIGVDIVDELLRTEKDAGRIVLLRQLRKEIAIIWYQ